SAGRLEGEEHAGRRWQRVVTDSDGFLQLGLTYGIQARNAVFWASTHIWVAPARAGTNRDVARIITDTIATDGEFRAARISGASLKAQSNKYRVWVNGILLPALIHSTETDPQVEQPHSSRRYGSGDSWDNFRLHEGWNHIVFQFDTTTRPDKTAFRFNATKQAAKLISSAATPATH